MTRQAAAIIVDTSSSPHARLQGVPICDVRLTGAFWAQRRSINLEISIPLQYEQCLRTGRIDNFRRAAGNLRYAEQPFKGIYFNDSDVYKWLEAAAWELACDAGNKTNLRAPVDDLIADIAAAQEPDGYIGTYFTRNRASERLTDFNKHELYCGGHLIQAAIAHYRATEQRSLLEVATKFADWMCRKIGSPAEGKKPWGDGHEEVEMALVELYRTTGERKYYAMAEYFIEFRGYKRLFSADFPADYCQDHLPIRQLNEATGHAVRAVYYACGVADILAETGEDSLRQSLNLQLASMTHRRMYVTGGIGSRWQGETFGADFELPNRAYAETCAAIGSLLWSWRMLLINAKAEHADRMEWTLYNAILPGVSLDGRSYFYQNPLEDDGHHRRTEWFGCACCPPNIARLLAQLPGYFYSVAKSDVGKVYVHQYAAGTVSLQLPNGRTIQLTVSTAYPWDGVVEIRIESGESLRLLARIPSWCGPGAVAKINGKAIEEPVKPGEYLAVERTWRGGDCLQLEFPMPVERIVCHPNVAENRGRVALSRGPILYAIEAADHPGIEIERLALPDDAVIESEFRPELLGGVIVLRTVEARLKPTREKCEKLYERLTTRETRNEGTHSETFSPAGLTAIPYFAWASRQAGAMQVWIARY